MSDAAPLRLLLVDDQELFLQGLSMILESQPGLDVVGTALDGQQAVERTRELQPDVVLMDIRMPVLDGIAATAAIRRGSPEAPPHVIMLTTIRHDRAVVDALRAGASGFLLKDARPEFLVQAIRAVVEGQRVIAPAETFDLLRAFAPVRPAPDTALLDALTERERELFAFAARGLSNADIAAQLWVAETTVKTHMRAILAKLGVASRVQLIALAYEHRLIEA
ncbi:response regulator [Agrococcus carbonis]|uniref:DNA-binding response regulator, NarL/FixJ family, contains REC and HTH domains n=1 Tax=Agrococcus carbonis TaxID=684552 RepID=A0A1H1MM32_9MICO|nr:response regulator transcription factor [Agrococcus carbonis]SDR87445.1 DNA-binding response regulator, NarL/FixJ family, contains REC and HTH domains [Agrococcus carbonis]